MEMIVLQVAGMSCAGCEQRIGTVLRRVEGVREVTADHTSGQVEIRIGAELTDPAVLTERIEAAGYQIVQDHQR
jgi:copper chaperone